MRILMAVATVALLAGCGTGGEKPRAGEAKACPGTTIVGIRGQGQSLRANHGLGTEVAGIAGRLADDLGDTRTVAIRHESRLAAMAEYTEDVDEGRRLLRRTLRTIGSTCPDSRLVVIGFSQGSQIAREELAARPALAAKVDTLVLVGSPVRDPDSPVHRVDLPGPEPAAGGSLGPGPDLGDLAARTVEACIVGDVVCAHDGTSTDYTIHKHAYEDADVQQAIADAAAARLG